MIAQILFALLMRGGIYALLAAGFSLVLSVVRIAYLAVASGQADLAVAVGVVAAAVFWTLGVRSTLAVLALALSAAPRPGWREVGWMIQACALAVLGLAWLSAVSA